MLSGNYGICILNNSKRCQAAKPFFSLRLEKKLHCWKSGMVIYLYKVYVLFWFFWQRKLIINQYFKQVGSKLYDEIIFSIIAKYIVLIDGENENISRIRYLHLNTLYFHYPLSPNLNPLPPKKKYCIATNIPSIVFWLCLNFLYSHILPSVSSQIGKNIYESLLAVP